jgi:DNA-binding beta-propeller fold protein YncE
METLMNVRNPSSFAAGGDETRYVESGRFPNQSGDLVFYRQPTSILAEGDGSAWVVAYGSNEIIRIDVNGIIRERYRGPINGFDRPYDIVRGSDGKLYLSEFRGSRISVLSSNGNWEYYIGSRGRGPGQFVGPQNLTVDEEGYLYVVDFGNRRISKFDPSGSFILSFGTRGNGFPGFRSPTGIAVKNGRIYVADNLSRQIYIFDRNGAYLGILIREGLKAPESLRFLEDGTLLAADANRILLIDPESAIVRELGALGNSSHVRITGAELDRNNNVLAADFQTGEVTIMTAMEDMASGLFVQIERIITDRFPVVNVEIHVMDRQRRPIVGLEARNFVLSERGQTVAEQSFLGAANLSGNIDIAILMERSAQTRDLREDLVTAARDISAASTRLVSVVSATEQPRRENLSPPPGTTPARALDEIARGETTMYSPRWRFDLGLRLAATDLLAGEKKRAVVFVGAGSTLGGGGSLGELAYEQYSLSQLAAYLVNNNIVFYTVLVGNGTAGGDLRYLCEETGGQVLSLYRNEGVVPAIRSLVEKPNGNYLLSYRSSLPTDFGRNYLPLEAEVYLMDRSGRDGTGYFPPLD